MTARYPLAIAIAAALLGLPAAAANADAPTGADASAHQTSVLDCARLIDPVAG